MIKVLATDSYFDVVSLLTHAGYELLYRTQTDNRHHRAVPRWRGRGYVRVTSLIFHRPGCALVFKLDCLEVSGQDIVNWDAWMAASLVRARLAADGLGPKDLYNRWDSVLLSGSGGEVSTSGDIERFLHQARSQAEYRLEAAVLASEVDLLAKEVIPYVGVRLKGLCPSILVPAHVFPGSWRKFRAEFPVDPLRQLADRLPCGWQPASNWWSI